MAKLSKEEKELLHSVEKGEWKSSGERKLNRYAAYAKATIKKDKRINIRLSKQDLHALQVRAMEEGIPYQTLIASILHKYISGRLADKKRAA